MIRSVARFLCDSWVYSPSHWRSLLNLKCFKLNFEKLCLNWAIDVKLLIECRRHCYCAGLPRYRGGDLHQFTCSCWRVWNHFGVQSENQRRRKSQDPEQRQDSARSSRRRQNVMRSSRLRLRLYTVLPSDVRSLWLFKCLLPIPYLYDLLSFARAPLSIYIIVIIRRVSFA